MNILFNSRNFLILSLIIIIIGFSLWQQESINVEIKGFVKKPGVYQIYEEATVSDVIELAGGLGDKADTSLINLSKRVFDEMVIIVYSKEEIASTKQTSIVKYVEKECICPIVQNDSCISINIPDDTIISSSKISLNDGTLEELMTLKGIGEAKARAIIEYRKTSKFTKIEDIMNIKGIGQSIYEKIKDNLSL